MVTSILTNGALTACRELSGELDKVRAQKYLHVIPLHGRGRLGRGGCHCNIQRLRNNIWHHVGRGMAKEADPCVSSRLQRAVLPTVDKGSLDLQKKSTLLVSWKPQMAVL